jgi:hypothetical protein
MRKIQFPFCILDVIQRKGVRVLYIIIPIVVLLLIFLFAGYVKAPPNKAAIITGLSKNPRVLLGKSGFKVPFFERVDWLEVGQININVVTEDYSDQRFYQYQSRCHCPGSNGSFQQSGVSRCHAKLSEPEGR